MQRETDPQTLTLEEVQRMLCRTLSDLEANVVAALEGPVDEEACLRGLDQQREQLEERVDLLRHKLTRLGEISPVDLNAVVSRVLDEVLMGLEKPLALHVDWRRDLPEPRVPEAALTSLLSRAIMMMARHADPGDRLSFATGVELDEVLLTVALRPDRNGPGHIVDLETLEAQCRPLSAEVHEMGGRFLLGADRGLRIELRLWVGPVAEGA